MAPFRWIPCCALWVCAGVAGCATPGPEARPEPAPAASVPAPPAPSPAATAPVDPAPSPAAATAQRRPGAQRPSQRTSGASNGTAPTRAAAPSPGSTGAASASVGMAAAAESAGPSVTTYVFSDAPAPVRREAARRDATASTATGGVPEGFNPYRIAYEPGTYRCELGRRVEVRSVSADLRSTVLRWGDGDYTLRSVDARSGALRYEDAGSGLAWIVLKDRSMLLDTRAGQRLANACRARG